MQSMEALELLVGIQSKSVGPTTRVDHDFFSQLGLIRIISQAEHSALKRSAHRVGRVTGQLGLERSRLESLQREVSGVASKLASRWFRLWSIIFNFSSDGIKKREREYSRLASSVRTISSNIGKLEAELGGLTASAQELDLFCRCGGVYCSVTDEGARVIDVLGAAASRLDEVELEVFLTERSEIWDRIQERLERRNAVLTYLTGSVGFEDSSKVRQFARSIAPMEGTPEQLWARAAVINNYLYHKGWKNYDRLRVVSVVIRHDGEIEQLLKELVATFLVMVEGGHGKSYGTWWEAANIMGFSGETPQERFQLFEEIQQELGKRGWKVHSYATGYMATQLVHREGTPEDLAEEFKWLEEAIIASGRNNCVESGIAASILFDAPGSDSEKADRFTRMFEAIQGHGWRKHTDRYYVAAILASMPGTVAENALLLLEVCTYLRGGKMDKDGFRLTDLALALLGSDYEGIMPVARKTSSGSSSSSYSSDDGFERAAASILTGGIVGGLLWD